MSNQDPRTVEGFGDQWRRFDQSELPPKELRTLFEQYFKIFPWNRLPKNPAGFDLGCGSGRWAKLVAPRVGRLDCIDASSQALEVARENLKGTRNCRFFLASVDKLPLEDDSMDFGYSLGVLHHLPDTPAAIKSCVSKLKRGAPLLLYLYYSFDNRPSWFKFLWRVSDLLRKFISKTPYPVRYGLSQLLAALVYFPLARLAWLAEKGGFGVDAFPLSMYRGRSFYSMRTDALDRFGTRLERRFSAKEIREMMERAGLSSISLSNEPPYWCAVGYRA